MRFVPGTGYDYLNDLNDQQQAAGGIFPKASTGLAYSPLPSAPVQAAQPPAPPLVRSGAQNFAGGGGDWNAIYGPKPTATANAGMPDLSNFGDLGGALNTAGQVNQFNLDYYRGAEQSDPIFSAAQRLLNPNDAQANYDVSMHGAELATARGVPGSGLASETTGRIREADIERRAALANSLLSGAHSRVPTPFDVGSQLLTAYQRGALSLQQAELELRKQVQLGQLDLERAKYYIGLLRGGGAAGGGGGGGNRNAPLPGSGGGAPSEYNPRNGPAFQSYNPLQLPGFGPRGAANATAPPPIVAPDNWDMLTPQQQQDYALQYRGNPANYGQDPWAAQEGDYSVSDYGPVDEWADWYD